MQKTMLEVNKSLNKTLFANYHDLFKNPYKFEMITQLHQPQDNFVIFNYLIWHGF